MNNYILSEIHKYDNNSLLDKYRLNLRDLVYLLILWKFLEYKDFIFNLEKEYELRYNGKEIKRTGSSNLDTNNRIEKNLISLWLISKAWNNICLTNHWEDILNEIYIKTNWKIIEKIELFLRNHALISFTIWLLWLIVAIFWLFN